MREYVLSAARHLAGAAAGAVTGYLMSEGLDPEAVAHVGEGVNSLVMGLSLGVYALTEKALKPLARRYFGSSGE